MSWDVYLFHAESFPEGTTQPGQGFEPVSIGSIEEFRRKVSEVHPDIQWSPSNNGWLRRKDWSMEIFHGSGEDVTNVFISVRGVGDPVTPLLELCRRCGWAAYDTGTGALIDLDDPSTAGWADFQKAVAMVKASYGGGFASALLQIPHIRFAALLLLVFVICEIMLYAFAGYIYLPFFGEIR